MLGANADRSLLTFAGSLPEADVVQELVHVGVEPLLTLAGRPDLDTLLHEPLHHEGRLVLPASQPVEHENEQHIELMLCCSLLDFHDSVSLIRADLIPGHSLLRDLVHDLPVRMGGCVLPAGQLLHRDVIVVDLPDGGDAVKANYSFHLS